MKVFAGEAVKNGLIAVEIGEVPPEVLTVMLPSQPGVQVGEVVPVTLTATAVGCVTQKVVVFVQLFASVTVTV
jgi:hypothetical protein